MKSPLVVACLSLAVLPVRAATVYQQPHDGSGTLHQSSWWEPDGSDYDQYVWEAFTLPSNTAVTEFRWRGGGGTVVGFTVEIWSSIQAGSQPDIGSVFQPNPLRHYEFGGNAGETPAGTFGGVAMYDYAYVLPAAFQAAAGTKYWVQIEAWQSGIPGWGLAGGTNGDGTYFRRIANVGDIFYQIVGGDAAFSVLAADGPTYTVTASASPANGGTIAGEGAYPDGSTASLIATPNAGFGFTNWTENSVQVSTSATYNFTVHANRTLVGHFAPAHTITTSASPSFGGSTTGDGVYNDGASVTVTATPNAGYAFLNWTEFGTPVSASASYTFTAVADRMLVANFLGTSVMFDFDAAPIHTSLPLDLTVDGLTAHFSATGQGFSIQPANTMGFTPVGFGGNCIYPNSIFAADLLVGFSQTLTNFSIMYAPQELGCDTSATMRATAYMNTAAVGTNTTTAPMPGTWPTGTLSINVPAGFNGVVVHYDARPPTCQDWGPIFLADNMLVTRVPADCTAVNNCSAHGACIATNTCSCASGWSGAACDVPTCAAVANCSGHGICIAPDSCQCDSGWSGPDCATGAIPAATFGDDVCVGGSSNGLPCCQDSDCPGAVCHVKNRFISFLPPGGVVLGIRTMLTMLDSNSVANPAAYNGAVRWVGPPTLGINDGLSGSFDAATLQCGFYAQDWITTGTLHVYGSVIVPTSHYDVAMCVTSTGPCSAPHGVATARFGDIIPPLVLGQPNFQDVNSIVKKFQGLPGGPSKTRAKLAEPINPSTPVNFMEVSGDVAAFQGKHYKQAYPTPPAICP